MKINFRSPAIQRIAFVFEGACLFGFGAGIAKYLGFNLSWETMLLAWFWVVCLQLAGIFFHSPTVEDGSKDRGVNQPNFILNRNILIGLALLTCISSITVIMLSNGILHQGLVLIMLLGVAGTLLVSLQPWRSYLGGYHEIVISFGMAVLIPWLSFGVQAGEIHRLLPLVTFPLFTLRLAMVICMEFSTYASDINSLRGNLLVRLGWQNGMMLHNLLILGSFLTLAVSLVFGLSQAIVLPTLSGLIIGMMQIYLMRRIAAGDKPNWQLLITGSVSLYALVVYLLGYSFWVR